MQMCIFKSAAAVRKCAEELIADLKNLQDACGAGWTDENFRRLDKFSRRKNPNLECFFRKKGEKSEFLWDFVAWSSESGIFLAAESEQQVHTDAHVRALKHDFEKLLYVYSPIRILITKAKDREHAKGLAGELGEFAHKCCLTFNPGAAFILHCGLYNGAGNMSFLWQSVGEPHLLAPEKIRFELIEGADN